MIFQIKNASRPVDQSELLGLGHIFVSSIKAEIIAANVRAWRCGDIPCYVSPDMLLSKDKEDENIF